MKYEVKKEHLKHYCLIVGEVYNSTPALMMGAQFTQGGEHYKMLRDAGVLDLWCYEVKEIEVWKDPLLTILSPTWMTDKILLLIRMQSWADYHNKMDGFVADWGNDMQKKYGVVIEDRITSIQPRQTYNGYLFQICVGTESRAAIMHGYFHKDIQSLIDKGLI